MSSPLVDNNIISANLCLTNSFHNSLTDNDSYTNNNLRNINTFNTNLSNLNNLCNFNIKSRRVIRHNDLVITRDENCLLIDNGCDQSIVSINSFKIGIHTGTFYNVDGAINGMTATNL